MKSIMPIILKAVLKLALNGLAKDVARSEKRKIALLKAENAKLHAITKKAAMEKAKLRNKIEENVKAEQAAKRAVLNKRYTEQESLRKTKETLTKIQGLKI